MELKKNKKSRVNQKKRKPRTRKRKLIAILTLRLLFGEPQLSQAESELFQSQVKSQIEISRVLKQESLIITNFNEENLTQPEQVLENSEMATSIPRGGAWESKSKSGPGPRAKADALANRGRNSKANSSKSSIGSFAYGFTVEPNFQRRPDQNIDRFFNKFAPQPAPDYYNPGRARGPRSITIIKGQRNSGLSTNSYKKVEFNDGYKAQVGKAELDHILVKHGHQWKIDDIDFKNTRAANNNLSPGIPEQVRTRLTPGNRDDLYTNIQNIANNSELEVYPNYPIDGDIGRGYLCPKTGLFLGINKNGVIRKAYVASENLINYLRENCL